MFLESIEFLNELNEVSVIVRFVVAMILGGVIGIERETKRRPAGFRTYVIVCLGSALIMMTNQYLHLAEGTPDSSRIASQVVSGIGFLGAGTILVTKNNQVKGLTTAAGLWAAAALGLAVGCGFYTGAIVGFLAILCSVQVLHVIDGKIYRNSRILTVYLELSSVNVLRKVISYAREQEMKLSDVDIMNQEQGDIGPLYMITTIRVQKRMSHEIVLEMFAGLEGVSFVEEIR